MRFRPTVDPVKRFWLKVDKRGPIPEHAPQLGNCWDWLGAKRKSGHGYFHVNRKPSLPHRFSYELHKGQIPDGHSVLHKCDRGCCVNPAHLFTGTQLDNMRDCSNKKRTPLGERSGSCALNESQIREIRRLYDSGEKKISQIAKSYPVGFGAISKIVHRQRWTHIV